MKNILFTLAMVAVSVPAFAAQVIGVADGDTLTILQDDKPLKIRLGNIDAPEKKQSFGERSKQSLSDLCYRKEATYSILNVDRYGRTVALVRCAGIDVSRAQVKRGMAWVYTQYNTDTSLPAIQAEAKAAHRGLWVDEGATPPWSFRRSN